MPGDTVPDPKPTKAKVRRIKPAKPVPMPVKTVDETSAPLAACFADRWNSVVRQLRAACIETNQESVHGLRQASRELRDIFSLVEGVVGADPIRKLAKTAEKFYRRCCKIQSLDNQIEILSQIVDAQWDPSLLESLEDKQVERVARLHQKVQAENLEAMVTRFELLQALVSAAYDTKRDSVLLNPYFESVSAAQKLWEQLDPEDIDQIETARLQLERLRSQAVFLQEIGLLDVPNDSIAELTSLFQASGQIIDIEGLLCRAERNWAKKAPDREHQLKLVAKLSKLRQQQLTTMNSAVRWSELLKLRA